MSQRIGEQRSGTVSAVDKLAAAGALLEVVLRCRPSRQTAAAVATALWRSLVAPLAAAADEDEHDEVDARMCPIRQVVEAKLCGKPVAGGLRARRNVAEHAFDISFADLAPEDAKRAQRGGRRRRGKRSRSGVASNSGSSAVCAEPSELEQTRCTADCFDIASSDGVDDLTSLAVMVADKFDDKFDYLVAKIEGLFNPGCDEFDISSIASAGDTVCGSGAECDSSSAEHLGTGNKSDDCDSDEDGIPSSESEMALAGVLREAFGCFHTAEVEAFRWSPKTNILVGCSRGQDAGGEGGEGDGDNDDVEFYDEAAFFIDELERLTLAAKTDPSAKQQRRRLIVDTAKRMDISPKELLASLKESLTSEGQGQGLREG